MKVTKIRLTKSKVLPCYRNFKVWFTDVLLATIQCNTNDLDEGDIAARAQCVVVVEASVIKAMAAALLQRSKIMRGIEKKNSNRR